MQVLVQYEIYNICIHMRHSTHNYAVLLNTR